MGFPLTPWMTLNCRKVEFSRNFACLGGYNMEHCRSPDDVSRVSVRLYYTMLSRIYLSVS